MNLIKYLCQKHESLIPMHGLRIGSDMAVRIPKNSSQMLASASDSFVEDENQFLPARYKFAILREPNQRLISGVKQLTGLGEQNEPDKKISDQIFDRFELPSLYKEFDEHLLPQAVFLPKINIHLFSAENLYPLFDWLRDIKHFDLADSLESRYDTNKQNKYNVESRVKELVEKYYSEDLELYEKLCKSDYLHIK